MYTITNKLELLGGNFYKDIPKVLTLKAIPTSSELEYVSAEDFDDTMLDKILPQAVEEQINFRDLYEVDYQWLCRCLRILNYGAYYTVNAIFCPNCNKAHRNEYQVDLRTVECKPMPEDFTGEVIIKKSEFLDFDKDITIRPVTIDEHLKSQKDDFFKLPNGEIDKELSKLCYMIIRIGDEPVRPVESKIRIINSMSSADYRILKELAFTSMDFGLRAGGKCECPVCHSKEAAYIALTDDKFFRPTLDELRRWKLDRDKG